MEIKKADIFIAFDGNKFFDSESCEKYEKNEKNRLDERKREEKCIDKAKEVLNIIIDSKYDDIINFEDLKFYSGVDMSNIFVSKLNSLSSKIHKKGGLNGGANLIIANPKNKMLVFRSTTMGSRYKIIYSDEVDKRFVYIMNNKLLDLKLTKKNLRMFGVMNVSEIFD